MLNFPQTSIDRLFFPTLYVCDNYIFSCVIRSLENVRQFFFWIDPFFEKKSNKK